jgi:hypothetical protein
MQIELVTGVTEKKDIQIQKGCIKAIGIVTTVGAVLAAVQVSLKLITKTGEKILYDNIPLLDLFEMQTQGEGLYIKDTLAAASSYPYQLPVAAARTVGQIPVTSGAGGYQFEDNDYFSMDLSGLTAGTTYRISTLEDVDIEQELTVVEKLSVQPLRNVQSYTAGGADYLALPRTALDKVQMFPIQVPGEPRRNSPTFTFEELMIMAISENDVVSLIGRSIATTPVVNMLDSVTGVDNLVIISLAGIASVDVYCTGVAGYAFYRVSTKELE